VVHRTKDIVAKARTEHRLDKARVAPAAIQLTRPPALPLDEWLLAVDAFAETLRAKYGTFSHQQLEEDMAQMRDERDLR